MLELSRHAGETLRAVALRAIITSADVRARFPRVTAIGCVVAVVLVALIAWHVLGQPDRRLGESNSSESTSAEPPYLVICNQCHARVRMDHPPAQKLVKERGLLRCPRCERFAAAWFRRGGSVVPPGGW